jgi:hypothetical protein
MIRCLTNWLGGTQGVTKHKIRQIGVFQRHRTPKQRFFLGLIRK